MCPERRNPAFSEERIEQAILGNLEQIEAGRKPAFTPRPTPPSYRPHPKYTGFLALYFHYCYLLGRIEKRQYPPRMTPHLRKEIMKADVYKARLKRFWILAAFHAKPCWQKKRISMSSLRKSTSRSGRSAGSSSNARKSRRRQSSCNGTSTALNSSRSG